MEKIIGIVFGTIVAVLCLTAVVMVIWNSVIPAAFGGPDLSYWQTLQLWCLTSLLLPGSPAWSKSK